MERSIKRIPHYRPRPDVQINRVTGYLEHFQGLPVRIVDLPNRADAGSPVSIQSRGPKTLVIGVTVTPESVYDSVPYLELLEYIHRNMIPIQATAADSAYDFPLTHRVLKGQEVTFFVRSQPAHNRTNVDLKRDTFSHDTEQDAYICSTGKQLRLNALHRSVSGLYWLY